MNNAKFINACINACADWGILPTAFNQCMTWEEQVLWIARFLQQEVIPTLNENTEAFNTLKTYVDDYFNNLDVQEEINNKLDEMAASGELGNIIARYIDPIQDAFEEEMNAKQSTFENSVNNTIASTTAQQNSRIASVENQVNSLANSTPIPVSSTSDMTDETQIYVNTTDGYWYYYDGEAWTQGGLYQSTGIDDLSIKNNMLAENSVTADKINDVVNLFSKATTVIKGKYINGYSTTDGYVVGNDANTNVLVFDLADLDTTKPISFKIDSTTATGSTSLLRMVYYKSSDLTTYKVRTYDYYLTRPATYNSSTGRGYLEYAADPSYDRLAITVNANFDLTYDNTYETPKAIAGDKIAVTSTDLRNIGTVSYNARCTGHNVTTYAPVETFDQRYCKVVMQLTTENKELIRNGKMYVNDVTTDFRQVFLYTPNTGVKVYLGSTIVASQYYDSTTKYIDLGGLIGDYLDNYSYIVLYFERSRTEMPLYSTYMLESNPNYEIMNAKKLGEVIMPNTIKMVEGKNQCIYYQNVLRYVDTDLIQFKQITNAFHCDDRVAVFTPESEGTTNCRIRTKDDMKSGAYSLNKQFALDIVPANAGAGTTKKVLMIGDSLTQNGNYTQRLLDLFSTDAMNIELIGTRGSGNNKHEGRAGWDTQDYTTNSTKYGFTNPFYNPSTQSFDFSYYMSTNNYDGVDYVFINLGTNDIVLDDADIISNINTMVTSIRAYDSNIKIGLWLPPVRGITETVDQNYLVESFKALRINKLFIDTYSNSQYVNLIPVYTNVNPYKDYPTQTVQISDTNSYNFTYCSNYVHPNVDGYYHIGDVLYAWIKGFAA